MDGATGVATDVMFVFRWHPSQTPDRYSAVTTVQGDIATSVTGGVNGDTEWARYQLQPATTYKVEIGWYCPDPASPGTLGTPIPEAAATFSTAP